MEKELITGFMGQIDEFIEELDDDLAESVENAATELKAKINAALVKGGPPNVEWDELSPITKEIRNQEGIAHNKPLYESGEMASRLDVREVEKDRIYEVGWFVSDIADRAKITVLGSEGAGAFIPITSRMRAMFMYEYGILLPGMAGNITIPPRPLLRPCAAMVAEKYPDNIRYEMVFGEDKFAVRLTRT